MSSCCQFPKITIDNPMLADSSKREKRKQPIQLQSRAQNHIYLMQKKNSFYMDSLHKECL